VSVEYQCDDDDDDDDDDDASWRKLLTHPPELSDSPTSRDIWERLGGMYEEKNFAYQCLRYFNGSIPCHKVLRHGAFDVTSHLKEGVLQIFIALKNPSPWPGFNPRPSGPVASTLTTTPLRQLVDHTCH
jgi:hypothetical protein